MSNYYTIQCKFLPLYLEKIYTGQKNLHGRRPPRPRQLSGMCRWGGTRDGTRVGNRGVVGVVLGSVLWVVIGEVLGVLLGFLRV